MAEQPPSDLLGALPRTRPHRRSSKRPLRGAENVLPAAADLTARTVETGSSSPARTSRGKARKAAAGPSQSRTKRSADAGRPSKSAGRARSASTRLRQPPQPRGIPAQPRSVPPQSHRPEILGTAVQAAAELAEIGLSVSARALRRAVARLPRP